MKVQAASSSKELTSWRPARAAPPRRRVPSAPNGTQRTYPDWIVGGALPRIRWDDPALQGFLRRGEPVVITGGCPLTRALVGRWTFRCLSEHYHAEVNSHFAPRHTQRFERFYGRGLGKGGVVKQSFKAFAERSAANEALERPAWRFYMQAPLLWGTSTKEDVSNQVGGELRVPERVGRAGKVSHAAMGEGLASDLGALDFEWLSTALASAESEGFHSATLWAGHGGGCTPMHSDATSNFFTQLVGRKRILVFDPAQWVHLYPYPRSHPMDSYVMVDVEAPDLNRFPALRRARGLECTLEPGDVLWLPSFWFHHVRQLDEGEENLSLNCWVGTSAHSASLRGCRLQSTMLGGRAREVEAANRALAIPEPTIEALKACGAASAAAAAAAAVSAAKRLAMEIADEALLARMHGLQSLHAMSTLEQKARAALGADEAVVGKFLAALADGADAVGVPGRAAAAGAASGAIGPPGSETHTLAVDIRWQLMAQLGAPAACAMLRAATRHGRIYPGPPAVGRASEVVNSEAKELTPPLEADRMLASGADGGGYCESPFLS